MLSYTECKIFFIPTAISLFITSLTASIVDHNVARDTCSTKLDCAQSSLAVRSILDSHIYKNMSVNTDECQEACKEDPLCASYNFKLDNDFQEICELNECGMEEDLLDISTALRNLRPSGSFMASTTQQVRSVKDKEVCKICKAGYHGQGIICKACRSDWNLFNGSCFKYFENPKRWDVAKTSCELSGSSFVSIHSSEENAFITSITAAVTVWIGLNDKAVEGTFTWIDGTPMDYSNWKPRQPIINDGSDDCARVQYARWFDSNCAMSLAFVCRYTL